MLAPDPAPSAFSPPVQSTDELVAHVYDELRELARSFLRRERREHTLQATALVHEVYLRLASQHRQSWDSRAGFFAAAARMTRRILVNHAMARRSLKRGGGCVLAVLREDHVAAVRGELDVLELDEILRQLSALDPRLGEIVELRVFGGLSLAETAAQLGVSERTVSGEWALARAWLEAALRRGERR